MHVNFDTPTVFAAGARVAKKTHTHRHGRRLSCERVTDGVTVALALTPTPVALLMLRKRSLKIEYRSHA